MAKAAGLTCETCGMVRAPTLAECPRCRANAAPEAPTELGEVALLDDGSTPSMTNLPSRAALATVPLVGMLTLFLLSNGRPAGRVYSYTELGWVSTALALALAIGIGVAGTLVLTRLASRLVIAGERANAFAIGAAMFLGVAPLVAVLGHRGLDHANLRDLEATPVELAECRWTEARQRHSRRTGEMLSITVHAECTLPDGEAIDVDVPLGSAIVSEGERLVVPTWPGRWYGRLVAIPDPSLPPIAGAVAF